MMEKKNEGCCTCAADFNKEMGRLVDEGTYTKADHDKKAAEVAAAFGKKDERMPNPAPHVKPTKEEKNGETC